MFSLKIPQDMSLHKISFFVNEDCQQPMATSGFPQNAYMNT